MAERRIILLGNTGTGKSSTGNSILGYSAFTHKSSLCSVTQCVEMCIGTNPVSKLNYAVCDTPGLLDTDVNLLDRLLEVQKSMEICKGPNVFLLIFSSFNRFTEDEQHTVDMIRILFGEKVFDHCIIVFTRGNVFKTDTEFGIVLKQSERFVNLLTKCEDRVVRIENNSSDDNTNLQDDIRCLMEMIENVSCGGKRVYQYDKIDSHKEVLKQYAEKHKNTKEDITIHLFNISKCIEEKNIAEQEALKADNENMKRHVENLKRHNEILNIHNEILENDNSTRESLFFSACWAIISMVLPIHYERRF